MRLWKTPERLRRIAFLFLAILPLLFIESLLVRRISWWQLSITQEGPYWGAIGVITLILIFGALQVKRWALGLMALVGMGTSVAGLLISFRQENVALGLYSIAFGILAYAYIDRLWAAFLFPALFPGIRWYQSTPEPIPGLLLNWGDRKDLRLSQLNLDGGFILGTFEMGSEKNLPSEVILQYRGSKITCAVTLISSLASKINSSWSGIGVEFKNTDLDSRKDLADFIEVLRGEGHVTS